MSPRAGLLVLVVGPSGAGKDTLLSGASRLLGPDAGFHFACRTITRPVDAGTEVHHAVSDAEFEAIEAAEGFILSWRAHGVSYGIDRSSSQTMAAGQVVVANVSRSVILAAARAWPVRVVEITASSAIRSQRLTRRGRETELQIAARLTRAATIPSNIPRCTIANDSTIEEGVTALAASLLKLRDGMPHGTT